MTQNRKLLISSSKMRDYIGQKCEQSLYLNSKLSPENKFKIVALWFVFKTFCYQIFNNFPKKLLVMGGGVVNRKEPTSNQFSRCFAIFTHEFKFLHLG